jgi:hypothetical protein
MGIFDGIGDMVSGFFHPGRGYKDARKEMEEKWRQAQGFQNPYNQFGQDQAGRLNNAENSLLDPSKLLAEWMSKYQESPYAKKSMENAKESGLDAASSMGLMGSSPAINNIQNSSSDIMNKDRQAFLQDLMQKYLAGVGIGQNIYNTGAQTAANMGNQAVNVGGNTAEMAYGEGNAPGDFLRNWLATGAKMGANMFSGGMGGAM